MKLYPPRKKALTKPKPVAKLYSLEPKDCYTIGEITEKFLVNESTVYLHIRKYSNWGLYPYESNDKEFPCLCQTMRMLQEP